MVEIRLDTEVKEKTEKKRREERTEEYLKVPARRLHEQPSGIKHTKNITLLPFIIDDLEFKDISMLSLSLAYKARDILFDFTNNLQESIKCSDEDCNQFTIASMLLVAFKNEQIHSVWNLFNLTELSETPRDIRVSAYFAPAMLFVGLGTKEWDNEVKRILLNLLNRPFPTEDGRNFIITKWRSPEVEGTSDPLSNWNSAKDLEAIKIAKESLQPQTPRPRN